MRRCQTTIVSPSELLREIGLNVSTRQFRRYLAGGIIPGVRRGKRGRYAIVGPVTQKRLEEIKMRILKFRCRPGRKKLNYLPPIRIKSRKPTDVKFPRFNLHASMIQFEWWMNKCEPLDFWPEGKKRGVLKEIMIAAAVGLRLADNLEQEIPLWDGTKTHLDKLRRR